MSTSKQFVKQLIAYCNSHSVRAAVVVRCRSAAGGERPVVANSLCVAVAVDRIRICSHHEFVVALGETGNEGRHYY